MKDRFKCRVWDGYYERYFYNVMIFSPSHIEIEVNCDNCPAYWLKISERHSLEQCLGLKDKKGNLIYEGDIVTKSYITPDGIVTSENDPSFIKEITFFKGCFGIFGKTNFHPIIEFIDYHQGDCIPYHGYVTIYDNCFLEVIGNIHENPELFKGDY